MPTTNFSDRFTVPSPDGDGAQIDCLSRAEAARRLGISMRTLQLRTDPRGPIKPLRWGRRVLYPVSELNRYIAQQLAGDGGNSVKADKDATTDRTGGEA